VTFRVTEMHELEERLTRYYPICLFIIKFIIMIVIFLSALCQTSGI